MNRASSKKSFMLQCAVSGAVSSVFALLLKKIHGYDIMNDLIKKKVLARNWTFSEISNLRDTISILCNDIFLELTLTERFQIVRDIKVNENFIGHTFEDVMRDAIQLQLSADIAEVVTNMLSKATVNFGGNNNEISERSLGGKPHKERTTDAPKSRLSEE